MHETPVLVGVLDTRSEDKLIVVSPDAVVVPCSSAFYGSAASLPEPGRAGAAPKGGPWTGQWIRAARIHQ